MNRTLLLTALLLTSASVLAAPKSADERKLEGMAVIGNQELPKSLYIVPWKSSDVGAAAPAPSSSLFAEGLTPVDPEVFHRELKYYDAIHAAR